MHRSLLAATVLLLVAAPHAGAQAIDAREILAQAAEAARGLRSVRYQAEAEIAGATSRRLVRGTVALARLNYSDPIGGKLVVRGEIERARVDGVSEFHVAYDGDSVRRYRRAAHTLLQGDPGYGGEALLGSSRSLLLDDLLAVVPYAQERSAASVSYGGEQEVAGVTCHVVHVQLDEPGTALRWFFGADDGLPRRREHSYVSARGNPVSSVLTVRALEVDVPLEEAMFTIEVEGARLERVGRRPPPPLRVGHPTPDFTLRGGDGRRYRLEDYRGQVVLLDFWATWCPHCQRAMPAMQRLHDTYGPRGFAVLGINCRDGKDADPAGFAAARGHTYPVLLEGNGVARDYSVRGIPVFMILDTEGRLLFQQSGFGNDSERQFAQIIDANLPR